MPIREEPTALNKTASLILCVSTMFLFSCRSAAVSAVGRHVYYKYKSMSTHQNTVLFQQVSKYFLYLFTYLRQASTVTRQVGRGR